MTSRCLFFSILCNVYFGPELDVSIQQHQGFARNEAACALQCKFGSQKWWNAMILSKLRLAVQLLLVKHAKIMVAQLKGHWQTFFQISVAHFKHFSVWSLLTVGCIKIMGDLGLAAWGLGSWQTSKVLAIVSPQILENIEYNMANSIFQLQSPAMHRTHRSLKKIHRTGQNNNYLAGHGRKLQEAKHSEEGIGHYAVFKILKIEDCS